MRKERPYVLCVAGFDPSGGAGLLADIKTIEANHAYGLGVCTSITYQNDKEFDRVDWASFNMITDQIDVLARRFRFDYAKIGLVESYGRLDKIIEHLKSVNPHIRIVWDPIIEATAGYAFHKGLSLEDIKIILRRVTLFTPNMNEVSMFLGDTTNLVEKIQRWLRNDPLLGSILLTGNINPSNKVEDILVTGKETNIFSGKKFNEFTKHGTGCVLSSAITANLANGMSMQDSCRLAKKYVEGFIMSNKTMLGYHFN
ncbi:MAG: hydroxymethylpyrimidine/phosphomethylpyrimidine kinase [Bacteroidetes bacterium]|nr:hydroxymethylpyrimidine/phosphomethylpyrimidine kinase [Bacteroidota bacterium]